MSIIKMIELKSGMCRWPFGDPKDADFHFCGRKSEHFLSYCTNHMTMSKSPATRNRNRHVTKKAA